MYKQPLRFNRLIAILSFGMLVTFVGCTPKITEEQLAKLRELRTETARLETEIKKQEADKASVFFIPFIVANICWDFRCIAAFGIDLVAWDVPCSA